MRLLCLWISLLPFCSWAQPVQQENQATRISHSDGKGTEEDLRHDKRFVGILASLLPMLLRIFSGPMGGMPFGMSQPGMPPLGMPPMGMAPMMPQGCGCCNSCCWLQLWIRNASDYYSIVCSMTSKIVTRISCFTLILLILKHCTNY